MSLDTELKRLKKNVSMDLMIIDPILAKVWLDKHANPNNRQGRKELNTKIDFE